MNFLGHTFVALDRTDDQVFVLGAALPDLASMARVRLDRDRLDGRLAEGVRCHVDADAVFHAHPEFRRGMASLRAALREEGLPPWPARAVAHVGWELLLDGTLVGSPAEAAFRRGLAMGHRATTVVTPEGRERWQGLLDRFERGPRWRLRYDDPAWVTERLHTILSHRPRLAFSREDAPRVIRVLSRHAERIAAVADRVLTEVSDDLSKSRHQRTHIVHK